MLAAFLGASVLAQQLSPRGFACQRTRFARSNRFAVYGRARLPRPRPRLLAQARGGAWVARTAPRVRAAALRVCSHGGASRLRADFSLSLRSPRRQAPLFRGFLLAGARRFAFSARAASRSQTKREFCIIEGSLTGFRPSATPSISEYSKNRAHIVRSGRAIFLRCLQNLRFVWLRLGFGFCAVRHRALVVLCLFPSFAFLFSLVYAATAPTRDGGRSSVPFLKKKRGFAALFSQKGLTFRRTSAILDLGAYCAGNFPVIRHSP